MNKETFATTTTATLAVNAEWSASTIGPGKTFAKMLFSIKFVEARSCQPKVTYSGFKDLDVGISRTKALADSIPFLVSSHVAITLFHLLSLQLARYRRQLNERQVAVQAD